MPLGRVLFFIAILYVAAFAYFGRWQDVYYRSDSGGYYLHLPATLLYHDVGNYEKTLAAWRIYAPSEPDPRSDQYGIRQTPTGQWVIKYPVGVALLQSPFFGLAHVWCKLSGTHPADGFSLPYLWLVGLSAVFYGILGLFFLEKSLRGIFSTQVVGLTVIAIGLATNLFFFSTYTPGMAHPCAFAAVAALLYFTRKWYESARLQDALGIGIAFGLASIIRVTDAIVILIPVLWGLKGRASVQERIAWAKKYYGQIIIALIAAGVCVLPQLFYWKFTSGQWFFNSYQGEQFHWFKPMIVSGLFSFKNGWLIYTPFMVMALLGIPMLKKTGREILWPLLVWLPLQVYITYSWWCWNYINGFGSRPMIDGYALLAIPYAALLQSVWHRFGLRIVAIALLIGCVALNLFQSWQTSAFILWSENANRAYYQGVFGQTKLSRSSLIELETAIPQPDTTKISKVKTLFYNALKDSTEKHHVRMEGKLPFVCYCKDEFCLSHQIQTDSTGIKSGDWLRVSTRAFVKSGDYERNITKLARLVLDLRYRDGSSCVYGSISVSSKIGNPQNIPWHAGNADEWGDVSFFVQVPPHFEAGGMAKAYIWNAQGQKIWIETVGLELWRKK
jgi:hypothetical protein